MAPLSPLGPILSAPPAYLPSPGIAVGPPSLGYDYASIDGAPAFISDPGFGRSELSLSTPFSIGPIDRGGVMYMTATDIGRRGAIYSPNIYSYGPTAGLTPGSAYPGFILRSGSAIGRDILSSTGSVASSGLVRSTGSSGTILSRGGSAIGTDLLGSSGSAASLGTARRANIVGISDGRGVRVGSDIMGAGSSLNGLGLNTIGAPGRGDIMSSSGPNNIRIPEGRGVRVSSDVMGASSGLNSLGLNTIGAVGSGDIASGGRNNIISERRGVGSDFMGGSSLNRLGLNTFGSSSSSDIGFGGGANSIGISESSGLGVMAGGSRLDSLGLNTLSSTGNRDIIPGGAANTLGISERTSLRVNSDALSARGGLNSLGISSADIASGSSTSFDIGALRNGITGGGLSTGMGPSAVSGSDLGLTGTGSSFSGSGTVDSAGFLNTVGISERAALRVGTLPDGISGGGATADIGAGTALDTASGSSSGLVDPLAMNAIAGADASQPISPGLATDVAGGSLYATLGVSGGDRLSGMTGGSSVIDRMQFTNSGPLRNTEYLSGGAGTETVGLASGAPEGAFGGIGSGNIPSERGLDPAGPL